MGKISAIFRRTFSFLSFRRKKTDTDSPVETDSLPATKKPAPDIDATLVNAQRPPAAEKNSGDTEPAETKPGIWKRITARAKQLFTKRSATPVETDATEIPLKNMKQSSPEDNHDNETNELKPGLLHRVSTRLTQLFSKRKKPASDDTDAPLTADMTAASGDHSGDDLPDTTPKRRRIPIKKLLILVLPVLAIILIIGVVTVMMIRSNTKQKEVAALEEKHKKSVEDELKKLKDKNNALLEENKKLRVTPAPVTPSGAAPVTSQNTPAENPAPTQGKSKAPISIGDCAVTSKESAGESLKRCIEAYNAASGH